MGTGKAGLMVEQMASTKDLWRDVQWDEWMVKTMVAMWGA